MIVKNRAYLLAAIAILWIFLPAGPAGSLEVEVYDECRRDYRIVNLAADTKSESRQMFEVVEFSNWLCKTRWEGKSTYVFKREEVTARGDRIFWDFILDPKDFSPVRAEKKIISRNGNTVVENIQDFRDPIYNHPHNTFHFVTLPAAFQRMQLDPGAKIEGYLLFNATVLPYHVFFMVEDEESVRVPAGKYDCLRIKMEFDYSEYLGRLSFASKIVDSFIPNYYFWVEKQPPHSMVKFKGHFGPPGTSPQQAQELVSVHDN